MIIGIDGNSLAGLSTQHEYDTKVRIKFNGLNTFDPFIKRVMSIHLQDDWFITLLNN